MKGGMDFPDDITTNVFRVGDIKEIHWTFYNRKPEYESALQNRPSGQEEDLAQLLQSAEHILRGNGRHVFLDKDKAGVWVFSLSHASDEGLTQNLGLDGIESTSVGSMRSGELVAAISFSALSPSAVKTARSTLPNAAAIGELNSHPYGSSPNPNTQPSTDDSGHKRRDAWDASRDHSISEVYSNFISAVSCSLSHSLGKRQEWIQVGPYACIAARTLRDDVFDLSDLRSWAATTSKISFDVKWLSSGNLLISFFQTRLPKHVRMSELLLKEGQSTALAVGSPLLLSPSGIRCQYLGPEDLPKSHAQRMSVMQRKASTLSRLAYQGIRLSLDIKWIQVETGREPDGFIHPPVSLWPADLCFSEDALSQVDGEDDASFDKSIVDGSTDPLNEAESWFLGKVARMEALQARKREETQAAQVMKDVEDTDDENALSPLEAPMNQGITPQDVSGIYPTPPDGLPPLPGSSNSNNLQSGDYDDQAKELQPSDEARGDSDGQPNDDLFGDMDIDMFASNGLTEADFSFFDEPDMIEEDLRETGQATTLDDTNEAEDHQVAFDVHTLPMTPQRDTEQGRVTAEDQAITGEQESEQASPTTDNYMSEKDYKALEPTLGTEDVDYGALEQLNLHRGKTVIDTFEGQRGSFEHVPFQESAFNFDGKYIMKGRFAFDVDELPLHLEHGNRRSHHDHHLSSLSIWPGRSPMENSVKTADDGEQDAPAWEDSDLDDGIDRSLEPGPQSSRKRKREQLGENDLVVTPSSSLHLAESQAGSPQNESTEHVSVKSESNAVGQTKDTANLEPRFHGHSRPSFTGRGQAFVEVAQLIAHQAVSGFLQSRIEVAEGIELMGDGIPDRPLQDTITRLLSTIFPATKRCALKEYVSLGEKNPASGSREQVILNQRSLKPTYPAGGLAGTGQSIFKLDCPYVRVRRNGISTEISASALAFWEELSLGPSHETKDIDVFCVCPRNEFIEAGAIDFLNMIKGAYQSCNLGSHDLGPSLADYSKRVVTVPMVASEPEILLQDIATTCEGLGSKLLELGLHNGTTVVYIVNPFKDQQYLPALCEVLLRLPNSYRAAREKRRLETQNDFVMQLVPLDLVWSSEGLVVPSPSDYRRLAFEVYNNCSSSDKGHNRESYFMSAPAIRLAKAVPKTIDFKLGSESSAPWMQSDNCVHVSYTWDATNEWLVAVWTDNLGVLSWSASYCLGTNEDTPWKPFSETVKEILETTFEMLHPPHAPWRLIICKDTSMFRTEADVWLRTLAISSRPSTSCTIFSVDANPSLTFTHPELQKNSSDPARGLPATPGATPQTNTPSPDISAFGSTPAANITQVGTPPTNATLGDPDSEARLIDVTDETWGIVMDGTLDDLNSLSDASPSLASGYLVKRAGSRDEDGLLPLGVNLIHGQKPYKAVLKEVLGMYRNLGALARVRGVVDPVKDVLPLHVAASRKAWKALSETMRYEPS